MSLVTNLIDKITELVKLKFEQLQLEVKSQVAIVLSRLIVIFAIALLLTFAFFFFGLGLAFYLNVWLESAYLGFVIVGGIALLFSIGLILLARSDAFTRAIKNNLMEND